MAHAMPSAILDSVLNQLASPVFQNKKLCIPLQIQLKDVRSKLELLKNVMEDAELLAIMFPDVVGKWVAEFQCMLYELDSIFDAALTHSMTAYSMVEKLRLQLYNMSSFHFSVVPKMKKINKRLEDITKECRNCNLIVPEPSNCQLGGGNEKLVARKGIIRYDPRYVEDGEFYMIGRDDAKEQVIKMLLDEYSGDPTVWIVGAAGVGKTTLCRASYNDGRVMNQFDVRLWVGAGDATEIPSSYLWKTIIQALNEEAQPHLDIGEEEYELVQLTNKIVSLIGKRKTLLVLDDIPHDYNYFRQGSWIYHLHNLIKPSHEGSKILITSTEKAHRFFLGRQLFVLNDSLSDEQCLTLFEKTAFAPRRHDDRPAAENPPEEWMKDMGKQIANRYLGHPSLIKGVATLLYGNDDWATWEYFAHEIDFHGHYDDYLTSSFLRSKFRKCHHYVSYVSLFSNYDFKFESLTDHLAAHGYAKMSHRRLPHFKAFSLLYVDDQEDWDTTTKFEVQSEVKEAVQMFAGRESIILELRKDDPPAAEAVRHVAIDRLSSSTNQQQQKIIVPYSLVSDLVQRRSLIFLGELFPIRMSVRTLDMLISNLQYLRVLDLHDLALKDLPNSIGKLIHLRYLDLSRNDFRVLPRLIYRLKNLQTLKLVYCDKLITLSKRIQQLRRLKHLEINMCLDLTSMPSRMTRLTCLERLDRFVVNPHIGGLRYLEDLDKLNGKLSIELPQQWETSVADAERAKLGNKKGLTTLEFKWQGTCSDHGAADDNYKVLEKLKPCSDLETLLINKFGGTRFPGWITSLGTENQLTEITISQCKRCITLPPFHQMPKLKSLTLTSLNIEYIQDIDNSCVGSNVFFPSLELIKIGRMPNLKRWSRDLATPADGFLTIKGISTVEIWNCPCLTMVPYFSDIRSRLTLQDVSKAILESFDCHGSAVDIISIQDLVSLPDWFITRLPYSLAIENCNQLQMLWEDEIIGLELSNSLVSLSISNCPAVKHLSSTLTRMPSLEYLEISKFSEELDCLYKDEHGLPWLAMRRLHSLTIEGIENLVAVPNGLRYWGYHEEHFGPLTLEIRNCKSLKWDVDSFPDHIHCLIIKSCPNFSKSIEELKAAYPDMEVTSEY